MPRLLYAYYGDDFTGSTDVLESLAEGGLRSVLLLREPTAALLTRFSDIQAVGLAGDSRSRSPEWMDEQLPRALRALDALGPRILHYKTCSTFDSSPRVGSVGRAMEIGARVRSGPIPLLIGAPHLGRYVAFGNLYADADGTVYRIDRHPTMSHHPVTPMREADLRLHLAAQTEMPIGHVPLDAIETDSVRERFAVETGKGARAVLFDGVVGSDLLASGLAILAREDTGFAVGSSGVTRALLAAWQARGVTKAPAALPVAPAVERLLVISGSCSPATAAQIGWAGQQGWAMFRVDPDSPDEEALAADAADALDQGRNTVIFSATGPLANGARASGEVLGKRLGRIARSIRARTVVRRIIFAGGDTSSHAVAELGLDALTWLAPLERGAPLCRAHMSRREPELELVLKGGQMGSVEFFETVRSGRSNAN